VNTHPGLHCRHQARASNQRATQAMRLRVVPRKSSPPPPISRCTILDKSQRLHALGDCGRISATIRDAFAKAHETRHGQTLAEDHRHADCPNTSRATHERGRGRKLGDDQVIRTRQDPSIPMHPEALNCKDRFHWTSRRSNYAVRDEEVVGSNPATPTVEQQVRGPVREIGSGPFPVDTRKMPAASTEPWRTLAEALPSGVRGCAASPWREYRPFTTQSSCRRFDSHPAPRALDQRFRLTAPMPHAKQRSASPAHASLAQAQPERA